MKKSLTKSLRFIIALSLPVVVIAAVAASVYLPSLFIKPQYSFVYSSGNDYGPVTYSVHGGKVMKHEKPDDQLYPVAIAEAKLYLHTTPTNTTREISLAEAQRLQLDTSSKSPDGFRVVGGNRSYFPLSGSQSDGSTHYLVGHGVSQKLDLQLGPDPYGDNYYRDSVRVIGWVK